MTAPDEDQGDSGPGFALPDEVGVASVPESATVESDPESEKSNVSDEAPLTEMQQAVIDHISKAQHQLGRTERLTRASRWGLWGTGLGASSVFGASDRGGADLHMQRVSEEDDEALFLAEQTHADDPSGPRHIVPEGGPPTPEEVHEAEMNPWPHHNMAETIEHNRQLRAPGQPDGGPTGAANADESTQN